MLKRLLIFTLTAGSCFAAENAEEFAVMVGNAGIVPCASRNVQGFANFIRAGQYGQVYALNGLHIANDAALVAGLTMKKIKGIDHGNKNIFMSGTLQNVQNRQKSYLNCLDLTRAETEFVNVHLRSLKNKQKQIDDIAAFGKLCKDSSINQERYYGRLSRDTSIRAYIPGQIFAKPADFSQKIQYEQLHIQHIAYVHDKELKELKSWKDSAINGLVSLSAGAIVLGTHLLFNKLIGKDNAFSPIYYWSASSAMTCLTAAELYRDKRKNIHSLQHDLKIYTDASFDAGRLVSNIDLFEHSID